MKLKSSVFYSIALAVSLIYSCKKIDTTDIGDDLIPAVDNVFTFDTVLDVETDNLFLNDSSRIQRNSPHAWGVIDNDPEFGKTRADIYFSLTPNGYGLHPFQKKDSTLIFDSVVLALAYTGSFGDTATSIQRMTVHEIDFDANFSDSIAGYRTDIPNIPYDLTVLGSKLIDFKTLDDSVLDRRKRDTLRLKNQLRIQLDPSLGNRFRNYDTATAYKNDSLFRTKFRGLALRVDEAGSPVKNALAYFSLDNANTRLIFYYRVQSGSAIVDTLVTEFGFYALNFANANQIARTPANNYLSYINNGNGNDDRIYLQSSPGSYATIKIPGLRSLSNRIIHRAELIFETLPGSLGDNIYRKPDFLFMDAIDTANKRIITVPYDFNFENNYNILFGGPIKNNRYIFNVSRYVQSIVTRKEKDYTLRLYAPYTTRPTDFASGFLPITQVPVNSPIAAGRVVLTGGSFSDPSKRVRLRIIYSKI